MDRDDRQEQRWAQWMRAAQQGDGNAYDQLLRAVAPFIRALTRRYCVSAAQIEDVVQDVLLTVHRIRHTWDPNRPFTPWLAAIAARRGIDRLRRELRIARHEVYDEQGYETFAADAANNDAGAVRAAAEIEPLLAALPARQRAVLEALKLRGLSLAQAAAESGQSVGAVKVSMHRALQTLRKLVGVSSGS